MAGCHEKSKALATADVDECRGGIDVPEVREHRGHALGQGRKVDVSGRFVLSYHLQIGKGYLTTRINVVDEIEPAGPNFVEDIQLCDFTKS